MTVEPEPVAESNWYVSIHGGIKFEKDWEETVDRAMSIVGPLEVDSRYETDNGWRVGGAIGYSFGSFFSIEGEVSYMTQDFDEITFEEARVNGIPTLICVADCSAEQEGDLSIFTGMVNFIVGFPIGNFIRPYAGAGIGAAHVSFDDFPYSLTTFSGTATELDDSDTTFAVQGFVGVDLNLSEQVAIGGRYRVLHLDDVTLWDNAPFRHNLDADLIHSAEVVLTFGF